VVTKTVRLLQIALISPSDVGPERDAVATVVRRFNQLVAPHLGLELELRDWEQIPPALDKAGPQAIIDASLDLQRCDIVVAIFWHRVGTPVSDARSGTEHELRIAYDVAVRRGRPRVMLYFNRAAHDPGTEEERQQQAAVLSLKQEYTAKGLFREYDGADSFTAEFERDLYAVLRDINPPVLLAQDEALIVSATCIQSLIRFEGLAELIGEVILTVSVIPRQASVHTALFDIGVFFNTNVTSPAGHTLLVHEIGGVVARTISGTDIGPNGIIFRGLSLGTGRNASVFRLSGIRVNANQLTQKSTIFAAIEVETSHTAGSLNTNITTPLIAVATAYPSLVARLRTSDDQPFAPKRISVQSGINHELITTKEARDVTSTFMIECTEAFPGAFEGATVESRSLEASVRFMAIFQGVPEGMKVFVTNSDVDPAGRASKKQALILSADLRVAGGDALLDALAGPARIGSALRRSEHTSGGVNLVEIDISQGSGTATWQSDRFHRAGNAGRAECYFGIVLCAEPDRLPGSVTATVSVGLAPISYIATHSDNAPSPRFAPPTMMWNIVETVV